MTFKKTVAIATAAGALAAISVPAMAFENEFHGLLNFNTTFSNFQDGGSGDFAIANTAEKKQMNNYIEQRARLQYIAKASDDLKMVTQFEINNRFGNINTVTAAGATKSGADLSGSDLDADGLSLVTKHVYLDFNVGKNFNTKLGIQPYKDTIKGLFIDADIPAIMTKTTMGAYTLGAGFTRFADDAGTTGSSTRLGGADKDLFMLDNTFAINKDTKAALSYYFLADYGTTGASSLPAHTLNQDILLSTLALSGETKLAGISLSGFAAMQAGHQKNFVGTASRKFHGYAANVAAKMAVGPGTAKTAFLFTSGNNSANARSYKGWVTSSVNSYNESGMMILARNTGNSPSSTDRYVRRNVTNIALLTMGYDAKLTEKLYANGNLGLAWTPASGETARRADLMGAELNVETGYKLYSNLTLAAQAAYMMLGGLYSDTASGVAGKDPAAPYSVRLHAKYSF
ncbi:MAG: histidine kinase [Geobacteraceae bacterium]|nr:histidine kinase [Geobacteraceae bacterium]NTW78681.1 histidine kinase [Geobacteraceae bacterium]